MGKGCSTRVCFLFHYNCSEEHRFSMRIFCSFTAAEFINPYYKMNYIYYIRTIYVLHTGYTKWTLLWSWLASVLFLDASGIACKLILHTCMRACPYAIKVWCSFNNNYDNKRDSHLSVVYYELGLVLAYINLHNSPE